MLCAGYIGSESFLEKVGETVMEMKKSNPKLVYGKCTACERHVFPALYLHLKVLPWNCLNCPKYVCKHIHVRMYILHGLLFGVLASFMYCAYIYTWFCIGTLKLDKLVGQVIYIIIVFLNSFHLPTLQLFFVEFSWKLRAVIWNLYSLYIDECSSLFFPVCDPVMGDNGKLVRTRCYT